jgi:hypothetical protein
MTSVTRQVLAMVLSISVTGIAQTQVATITSSRPFQLRGANVNPGPGVPTWPVMPGDAIRAGDGPLTLGFPDGSTIVLAPRATATVDVAGRIPVFRLESGAAHYGLKTLDGVKLVRGDTPVTPHDLVGDLQFGDSPAPVGAWTTGQTSLIIAGAAGAVGLSVGLARRNGPPVSPTQCNNGNAQGNGLPACQ